MSLFTPETLKLKEILSEVDSGRIGLPDLQRPYVWEDAKVRDLLDSMLKGYPVGYIMLWKMPDDYKACKRIGTTSHHREIEALVIDGQQRLTGLLSTLYHRQVIDKNFKKRFVKIAYNLLSRDLQVWSKGTTSVEWIEDVGDIFQAIEADNISGLRKRVLTKINQSRTKNSRPQLTEDEEEAVERNLDAFRNLKDYEIPTLKISRYASDESVADIFVRVNSGGNKLTEKDFIDTLLAVYDPKTHSIIHSFCADSHKPIDGSAYNQILDVTPAHLIRVSVALAFDRARLKYAYLLLRGRDFETRKFNDEVREANLLKFRTALGKAVNLNEWHSFLNLFSEAGYLNKSLVASENAIVFSYALYLTGKFRYKVNALMLKRVLVRWIFMATITGFYTGSTESNVEKMYADFRTVKTANDFVRYLDAEIESRLSNDFFNITLPKAFLNSSATAPEWLGFIASLNVLTVPMWLGNSPLSKAFLPGSNGTKKSFDKHHIFPKAYLEKIGITDDRIRNQAANFTFIDATLNIDIADAQPKTYAMAAIKRFGRKAFEVSCRENAIPSTFYEMTYTDFVASRKRLMAEKVREAFKHLKDR